MFLGDLTKPAITIAGVGTLHCCYKILIKSDIICLSYENVYSGLLFSGHSVGITYWNTVLINYMGITYWNTVLIGITYWNAVLIYYMGITYWNTVLIGITYCNDSYFTVYCLPLTCIFFTLCV